MDLTAVALTVALGLFMVVFVRAMRENAQTPPGTPVKMMLNTPPPEKASERDMAKMGRDLVRRRDRLRRFKAET